MDGVEVVNAPGEGDDTIAEANHDVSWAPPTVDWPSRSEPPTGPSWLLDQLID